MENAIEIKGLLKKYGKFVAVNGIDLAVKSGELFALLGENGAGKTTTIKVLCALAGYDSGEVKVCGYDVKTQAKARQYFPAGNGGRNQAYGERKSAADRAPLRNIGREREDGERARSVQP